MKSSGRFLVLIAILVGLLIAALIILKLPKAKETSQAPVQPILETPVSPEVPEPAKVTPAPEEVPEVTETPLPAPKEVPQEQPAPPKEVPIPQGPFIYYVSPSGNDENPGTSPDQAWRTIDRVNQGNYQAGDQILFQGGSQFAASLYLDSNNCHGTQDQPVTIGSYGSGRATIASEQKNGLYAYNVGNLHIANLNFSGSVNQCEGAGFDGPYGISLYQDSGIPLKNIAIDQVEVTGYCVGVAASVDHPSRYIDLRIEKVIAHDNLAGGIILLGPEPTSNSEYALVNVYVGYCQTYRNPGVPYRGQGVNFSGSGIFLYQVDRATMEHNLAYENGGKSTCIDAGNTGGPSALWAYGNRITLQYNEVYRQRVSPGCPWEGGALNVNGSNSIMQYNYSHDNDGPSFLLDNLPGNRNNVIRYNISENDGLKSNHQGMIRVTGGDGNYQIYNNTIYANGLQGSKGPLVYVASSNDHGAGVLYRVHFRNNLFIRDDPPADAGPFLYIADPENIDNLRFEGNAYFDLGNRYEVRWGGDVFRGIETWSLETGQERGEDRFIGRVLDPRLCERGKGGILFPKSQQSLTAYRLRSDSPLIDKGQDLTAYGLDPGGQDFFGNPAPAGNSFDIGAHEYQQGQSCS